MKKVLIFVIGIMLLGGGILLGGYFLVMMVSQPCGWLDSYIHHIGCIHQLELGGIARGTFTRDLTMFAGTTAKGISIWQLSDGSLLGEIPGHIGVFSPDGAFFAGSARTISVWDTHDWTLRSKLNIETHIAQLAIAPDMSSLAIAFRENSSPRWQLQVLQTSGGKLLHKLEGHTDDISSIVYSPDGTMLASGSDDHTVRLWRIEDGTWLKTLKGHSENIAKVAFAPDGRTLASSSWDSTIRIWQTDDGTLLYTMEGDNRIAFDLAYSPDGSVLASAGTAGLVQLWDVNKGILIRSLRENWRGTHILSLAFSPDGKVLAVAQQNGIVRLYNVQQLLGATTAD